MHTGELLCIDANPPQTWSVEGADNVSWSSSLVV